MSCIEIRNMFSDTIDGRASVTDIAAVDRHVAGCAACRTELEDLRRVLAAVKAMPQRKAPAGFAQGVMSRIATSNRLEAVPHAPRRTLRLATILKFAASAAAAVIVCVGIVRLNGQETTPQTPVARESRTAEQPRPAPELRAKEVDELAMKLQGASDLLKVHADDKAGAGLEMEKELASRKAGIGAASKDASKEPGGLSLQRITVYSNDVAGDSEQVAQVLRASGYTFSSAGEDGRMLVKVPKAEATQILAALEKSRARVELGATEKLEHAEKQAQEAGIADAEAPKKADGLIARADQVEGAFRRLRELRSENERRRGTDRDAHEKKKAQEELGDAVGDKDSGWGGEPAKTAGGESAGAPRNGAAHGAGVAAGGKSEGKEGKAGKDKNKENGSGGAYRDPKPAGAVPPGDAPAEEGARQDEGRDPQAPGAPATAEPGSDHNESDDLQDDVKKLKGDSDGIAGRGEEPELDETGKLAEEADEVFLVIEFRSGLPPAADPAPKPVK